MRATTLITHVQLLLGDPEGQFHPTDKMLIHLNTAIEDICTRSRTISSWLYIPTVKNQGTYGLPESFLDFHYVGYYYRDELIDLTPGGIADTAPAIFSQKPVYKPCPHTYSNGGNAYIEKVVSTVQASENYQNVYPGVGTGTFTSGEETPTVLIGDRLINITDNSEGIVSGVDAPNGKVTYENLANGASNRMQKGDQFRILSRTEHRHSLNIAPPPQKTDAIGAESIYVFYSRTHIPMEMSHLENRNDELEIDTEWHNALRHRVCYYAVVEEKGIESPQAASFAIQYETEYKRAFPKARRRIRQAITHWKQLPKRPPPKVVISSLDDETRKDTIIDVE